MEIAKDHSIWALENYSRVTSSNTARTELMKKVARKSISIQDLRQKNCAPQFCKFSFELLSYFLMDDSMIYQTASFYCTVEHSQLFTGFSSNDSKKLRKPSLGNSRLCPHDVILSTHVFLCCKICSHSVQYSTHVCHVLQMFSCFCWLFMKQYGSFICPP